MIQPTTFEARLLAVSALLGDANQTKETRDRTVILFANTLTALGHTHLQDASDLCAQHLRDFLQSRSASPSATYGEMEHIIEVLKFAAGASLPDATDLIIKALGIGGITRVGTKAPVTLEEICAVCQREELRKRPGRSAMLQLTWEFGLQAGEALHTHLDTLQRWRREVSECGRIEVVAGCKYGRRTIRVLNRESAMQVLMAAEHVATTQGGYLVTRFDGTPLSSGHTAHEILHGWWKRWGIQLHAVRNAYSQRQLQAYLDSGVHVCDALRAVSMDLGLRVGNVRWVGATPCIGGMALRQKSA